MGSTTLNRSLLTDTSLMGIVTDTLGTATGTTVGTYTSAEVGKGVKMAAGSYIAVAVGNEIEGIVNSVSPGVRNGGMSYGGIQIKGRAMATVAVAQVVAMAVGDLVCAAIPAVAVGTAGYVTVQSDGVGYVAPADFKWRCISTLTGAGADSTTVIIERI